MKTNQALDPDLQNVLTELNVYHEGRLRDVQERRTRKGIAVQMDGDYSLIRLLQAMRNDSVQRTAPFEYQCSQRIAEQIGREPRPSYYFIPVPNRQDLQRAVNLQRDLQQANTGGNLISTSVGPGGLFVHYLDSFFPFQQLGIQRLTLQQPATIPGMSGTVSTTWLQNETSTLTESQFTFVTSTSTPKTLGAYIEASGQLLKQTSVAAEAFIIQALARAVSAELSRKILTGSGANGQIQGIFGYSGVGSVAGATANYAMILDLIETVETANALLTPASAGFVMPANVAKLLRAREKATGSGTIMTRNDVAGYQAAVTQGASANTLTFGDWSQLSLLEYGALEIGTDPYGANSALFKSGIVGVRCLWTVDVILLNPKSFVVTGALS